MPSGTIDRSADDVASRTGTSTRTVNRARAVAKHDETLAELPDLGSGKTDTLSVLLGDSTAASQKLSSRWQTMAAAVADLEAQVAHGETLAELLADSRHDPTCNKLLPVLGDERGAKMLSSRWQTMAAAPDGGKPMAGHGGDR